MKAYISYSGEPNVGTFEMDIIDLNCFGDEYRHILRTKIKDLYEELIDDKVIVYFSDETWNKQGQLIKKV